MQLDLFTNQPVSDPPSPKPARATSKRRRQRRRQRHKPDEQLRLREFLVVANVWNPHRAAALASRQQSTQRAKGQPMKYVAHHEGQRFQKTTRTAFHLITHALLVRHPRTERWVAHSWNSYTECFSQSESKLLAGRETAIVRANVRR